MCDYSLHSVATRPAKVGDKLVSTSFRNSITRGFAASNDPDVAVCLMPGTELAFDDNVEGIATPQDGIVRNFGQKVARFRQINQGNAVAHHDALEFPNGKILLVTNLRDGQKATVLQLPLTERQAHDERKEARTPTPNVLLSQNI